MESRNITLTLEKAKEWYNSGSSDLKEVALQAYTVEELTTLDFTDIRTFEQAAHALGIREDTIDWELGRLRWFPNEDLGNHLIAIYKLDIIHRALNKDWEPSLTQGRVYYPYVRIYLASQKAREVASRNGWVLGKSFTAGGQKYTLVGGECDYYYGEGPTGFNRECGGVLPNLGLLGCKSLEIAKHMSCYFSKEIFEATYAPGTYKWV